MDLVTKEREKYQKVWDVGDYRRISPGELAVLDFLEYVKPLESIVDIGCGTGRAAKKIYSFGHKVELFDIAENCRDQDINLPLTVGCMWEDPIPKAIWGYCTDVMEHIPEEKVDDCLKNIAKSIKKCYFRIYLHEDNGKFVDEPLHLTVKPTSWWLEKLNKHWSITEVIDNGTVCTFVGGQHA